MRDQYFHFDHLPPNLQRVSKPFAEAAEAIKRAAGLSGADARKADAAVDDAIGECRAALEGAVDADEAQVADTYLVEVMNLWDGELLGALRLLLCAKDCAIRSHLPDVRRPADRAHGGEDGT